MAVEPLQDHASIGAKDLMRKINELVEAVNQLGAAVSVVWGDVPKPDGWKWE